MMDKAELHGEGQADSYIARGLVFYFCVLLQQNYENEQNTSCRNYYQIKFNTVY